MPGGNKKIQTINLKTTRNTKIKWVNIINAQESEIDKLHQEYKFDLSDLHDASSHVSAQHAKINAGDNYLFTVFRFPFYDKKENTINGTEVDFFVGKNYLIMLHAGKLKTLKKIFSANYQARSATDLFYKIMDVLIDNSFSLLDDLSEKADEVENLIFSKESKVAATTLLDLRRGLINLRSIVQNYQSILEKFERFTHEIHISSSSTYTLVDEKTKDLWNTIENRKQMVEALYATNESILNYRLNDIMKTLTIFSVIVFPLTLLAAVFGMNTMNSMPFVKNPNDFWIIVIIMLVGCMIMLGFFKWKKWV